MVAHTYNLIRQYRLDNGSKTFLDGFASGFIRSVKIALGGNEIPNYEVFVEKTMYIDKSRLTSVQRFNSLIKKANRVYV